MAAAAQPQSPARGVGYRVSTPAILAAVVAVALLAIVPPAIGGFLVRALTSYLIFGLLALGVGLITGYGRLFNLGVGVNFGVSAYAVAMLSQAGITNPLVVLLVAMGIGLLVGLLFGFYALVSSGTEYLMLTFLTTLAFATIPYAFTEQTGGDNGLAVKGGLTTAFGLDPLIGHEFYWLVLGVVVLCTLLSWFVLHSQAGKAVQAIGRNPSRAAAMGYNVGRYRVALTLYAGWVASMGGWLYALQKQFVHHDLLGLANSTNGLVYALVGGVDTIVGPLVGTVLLQYFTDVLSRGSTQSSLYIGIVLMLVVYFLPEGVLGLWRRIQARRARGQRHPEVAADVEASTGAALADERHEPL